MKITSEALDEFYNSVLRIVESISNDFEEPNADWVPSVTTLGPTGAIEVAIIDPHFLENDYTKEALALMMTVTAVKTKAVSMVFVSSTWMSMITPEEAKRYSETGGLPRAGEMPNRKEALVLNELRGDVGAKLHYSYIERHKDAPPTLGPWQVFEQDKNNRMEGRLVDPVENLIMASYCMVTTAEAE